MISDQLFLHALSVDWTAEVHHRDIDELMFTNRHKSTATDLATVRLAVSA